MSLSSVTGGGLYNYATISNTASYAGSYSSGHSRDPSHSRRPSIPMSSYPASTHSRTRNSTDSRADPPSHARTSESSHATKATSVNEEAMRYRYGKHQGRKDSRELSYSSTEQPRHRQNGHHRHSHHAYHSHHPGRREDRYHSSSTKSRRRAKYVASPPDLTLSPPPVRNKVMAVKSNKKNDKNTGNLTWRRITQGIKMGKSKKAEQTEQKPPVVTETKPRRKSKWRFWAKQEPDTVAESNAASSQTPKPKDEMHDKLNTGRRLSITEWLSDDSSFPQSPTTLKRLFEEGE